MNEISLIKDTSKLSSFINLIQDSSIIGIDTEFMRRTTYWPVLCLIQISDGINTGIIDLISTNIDLSPLFKFLENRSIKKIFHSGEQDLEILWSKGASVKNIYDTQIASMFSGYKSQISYSDLVNTILNIKINKSQQNSNWQIRPLKDKQIQYAAEDVIHLPLLYKKLNEYIIQKDLNSWVSDEMDNIEKIRSLYIKKIEIKSLSDLKIIANNDSSLINLISSWRENIAQKNNVPRSWVCSNSTIKFLFDNHKTIFSELEIGFMDFSYINEDNINDLKDCVSLFIKSNNNYSNQTNTISNRSYTKTVKNLRALLDNRCNYYKISPQLVANRFDLEKLAKNQLNVRALNGWRFEIFGKEALDIIRNS